MTDATILVPSGSKHPFHKDLFKTLDLLRLYDASGRPVYFVIEGLAVHSVGEGNPLDQSYSYDEHNCPTNYVRVAAIITREDDDPHGVFDYVRSVWMPPDYDPHNNREMIRALFPEISA